jgi:WD40 repeat protein
MPYESSRHDENRSESKYDGKYDGKYEGDDDGGSRAALELEHAIGYSGISNGLYYHPQGSHFVFASGGNVVVQSFVDPHDQVLMSGVVDGGGGNSSNTNTNTNTNNNNNNSTNGGHTNDISCMTMSKSGRYFATGEVGSSSDVIVWDFATRSLLFRLSEHDNGITTVAFSDDELLLCTVGNDNKLIVWDLSNGYIVVSSALPSNAVPCRCLAWGGMVKDVKRRDTSNYLLVTSQGLTNTLYDLDPYMGTLTESQIHTTAKGEKNRENNTLEFSADKETIYCGTTSGDFALINVRLQKLSKTIPCCRQGVTSLLTWPEGVICGGGDGTITTFDVGSYVDKQQCRVNGPVGKSQVSIVTFVFIVTECLL